MKGWAVEGLRATRRIDVGCLARGVLSESIRLGTEIWRRECAGRLTGRETGQSDQGSGPGSLAVVRGLGSSAGMILLSFAGGARVRRPANSRRNERV